MLNASEQFFYDNAGYSHSPALGETEEDGHLRCARELAISEEWARERGYTFEWHDEARIDSHKEMYGEGSAYEDYEPETCEFCVMTDSSGLIVGSMGCIDDATPEYRRVIEAELADEVRPYYLVPTVKD